MRKGPDDADASSTPRSSFRFVPRRGEGIVGSISSSPRTRGSRRNTEQPMFPRISAWSHQGWIRIPFRSPSPLGAGAQRSCRCGCIVRATKLFSLRPPEGRGDSRLHLVIPANAGTQRKYRATDVPANLSLESPRLDSDSFSIPLTSLRWCAKVLMMRMHRQRHEALFASSLGGERGSACQVLGAGRVATAVTSFRRSLLLRRACSRILQRLRFDPVRKSSGLSRR